MNTNSSPSRKPLRLWPGVAIVSAQLLLFFVVPNVFPDVEVGGLPLAVLAFFAAIAGGLLVALWWLFFSRAAWLDRAIGILLPVLMVMALPWVVDASIAGAHMGFSVYVFPIPGICLALLIWAAATQRMAASTRRGALVAAIALACLPMTLIRTAGLTSGGSEYHWRWTPTPEERLLTEAKDEPLATAPATVAAAPPSSTPLAAPNEAPATPSDKSTAPAPVSKPPAAAPAPEASYPPAEWPGFRGPGRDGVVRGVQVLTDWQQSPPVALWRRPIGPAWSSFSVRGDLIYTQEQRGDHEMVSCYRLSTGDAVWRHRDAVRFWESNGGAGPRATPTIHRDRVLAFGATGILNALDALTGRRLWSRNVAADTGRRVPDWGFASSPLVVGDVVIVAASGTLAGYDVATGEPRWTGPSYGGSYSSPHRVTLDGVEQVVLLGGPGAISVNPRDGKVLWEHKWMPGPIVQPAMTPDGDIIVNAIVATGGNGTRRLHVTQDDGGWHVEERWTSNGLKPYFNDLVVHEGHAYGFDGSILASIDLETGTRKWKGGRYGNGQLVLLADQDLLLVMSEDGEIALVSATPDQYREVARVPALNGKTWNHPVVVGDVLLVRNGEEMAAFRLPLAPPRETR